MMVPAIYSCANLIAGALSALPLSVGLRKPNGEVDPLYDDPIWWVLNEEFCPRWVASAAWEYLALSRLFHGDAFAEIIRKGSNATGLIPIHPLRVTVAPWSDGTRLAYAIQPDPWATDRSIRVLDQDDMLHVPGLGFDGCRSLSPLRYQLRMAGGVAKATQDYQGQFFKNMARPDYVLSMPGSPTPDVLSQLRDEVSAKHGLSAGMGGRPMLLSGGVDLKTVQLSNKDAELVAMSGMQIEDVARVFNVPPFMIGHNEKTTSFGTGVGEIGKSFVRYALRQHLNAFETEFNRKLFRSHVKICEFDTFDLESADLKSLIESFRMAIGRAGEPGFMTTNEVRRKLRMNRIDGGDMLNPGIQQSGSQNAQIAA